MVIENEIARFMLWINEKGIIYTTNPKIADYTRANYNKSPEERVKEVYKIYKQEINQENGS